MDLKTSYVLKIERSNVKDILKRVMQDRRITRDAKAIYAYLKSCIIEDKAYSISTEQICCDLDFERYVDYKRNLELLIEYDYVRIRMEKGAKEYPQNNREYQLKHDICILVEKPGTQLLPYGGSTLQDASVSGGSADVRAKKKLMPGIFKIGHTQGQTAINEAFCNNIFDDNGAFEMEADIFNGENRLILKANINTLKRIIIPPIPDKDIEAILNAANNDIALVIDKYNAIRDSKEDIGSLKDIIIKSMEEHGRAPEQEKYDYNRECSQKALIENLEKTIMDMQNRGFGTRY